MLLFPIGELQTDSSQGVLDSDQFSFFEPNSKVLSHKIFAVDSVKLRDQTLRTTKRAEPFLTLVYEYDNIFNREFTPIDMFMTLVGGPLEPFFTPDLTRGEKIKETVTFPYQFKSTLRRLYTPTVARGANYALVWNGTELALAHVDAVGTTHVLLSRLFGAGSLTHAVIYPVYEVFLSDDSASTWEPQSFVDTETLDRGYTWSGKMSFTTRWPVG